MSNRYLTKVAETISGLSNEKKEALVKKLTWNGMGAALIGGLAPVPLASPIANSYVTRRNLEKYIPEKKKGNWVGTKNMLWGELGGTAGGTAGAVVGAVAGGVLSSLIKKDPKIGATIGAITGAIPSSYFGAKAGRRYHLNTSDDFK